MSITLSIIFPFVMLLILLLIISVILNAIQAGYIERLKERFEDELEINKIPKKKLEDIAFYVNRFKVNVLILFNIKHVNQERKSNAVQEMFLFLVIVLLVACVIV